MLLTFPLAGLPNDLRTRKTESVCKAFESLRDQYVEAMRNRNYQTADDIQTELVKYLSSEKQAIAVVGGPGAYVVVDLEQISVSVRV
jgi:hypothetical protein